jgi:nucleoside-diphosphate-sugar epimerase
LSIDGDREDTDRIVVTGGAGFLGSHLCDALIARGNQVICVDNFLTGSRHNIAHLEGDSRFQLVIGDVSDGVLSTIDAPLAKVFHLACPASPVDYLAYPLETLAVGSDGTRAALMLADACHARMVLTSTSEVYGEPAVHPQPESYWGNVNPIGPRSVYDESKRYAEALTMAWHRVRGTNVGVARIFNTYGPRMRSQDGRVVSNFLYQALTSAPLTVYGDGTQTRSLCFVEDLVGGLVALMESGQTGPINLGNPEEHTILEIAELVLEVTNSSSSIELQPSPRVDDPSRRCPDIRTARSELKWEPTTPLLEGLTRTAEDMRAMLGRSDRA